MNVDRSPILGQHRILSDATAAVNSLQVPLQQRLVLSLIHLVPAGFPFLFHHRFFEQRLAAQVTKQISNPEVRSPLMPPNPENAGEARTFQLAQRLPVTCSKVVLSMQQQPIGRQRPELRKEERSLAPLLGPD